MLEPSSNASAPGARKRVGIVGARGHVGAALIALIDRHEGLELAFVGSRALAGQPLERGPAEPRLCYQALDPSAVAAQQVDAVVLALPNGLAAPYVKALAGKTVLDLSADHRFDEAWTYGLPELGRAALHGAKRIANPGCYATAAQLALAPLCEKLASPPRIFGVSGYSGAGTTPSPRNDPAFLQDNLIAYSSTGHVHEREISHRLGQPVHFMPHVASFFRGISLTIDLTLSESRSSEALLEHYQESYADEPLVDIAPEIPQVRDAVGKHRVTIGGFATQGTRLVLVATIDNLLKGAASQALQNLNLALGMPEFSGLIAASNAAHA